VVVIAMLPLKATGTDANVQLRGLTPRALEVHDNVRLTAGRFFQPGMFELVVGRSANLSYAGLDLGDELVLGAKTWKVVGLFDAGGSALDSEIWMDADLLNPTYQRPRGIAQTVVVRLVSQGALEALQKRLEGDPRVTARAERETEYYARASQAMTQMIQVLGSMVAIVMGVGAVFAALNTMYSAVAERAREIATLRALGFSSGSVVLSFLSEALFIAAAGGLLGCILVLPVNGLTTGTLNFQTFSHLSFAFRITLPLLGFGLGFALLMGVVGGLPPALRAARLPITVALRDM
jgi:putative ABC transport system permease protein